MSMGFEFNIARSSGVGKLRDEPDHRLSSVWCSQGASCADAGRGVLYTTGGGLGILREVETSYSSPFGPLLPGLGART